MRLGALAVRLTRTARLSALLPWALPATAVRLCVPSARGTVAAKLPLRPVVMGAPAGCPSTRTCTREPGAAVPVTLICGAATLAPSAGAVMTGAGGALIWSVKFTLWLL